MDTPFFTADTHFWHTPIIQYCNRPFASVEEMNETLIKNWNAVVPPRGLVYHIGDFAWGRGKGYQVGGVENVLSRLNGQIFLIEGSHDKPAKQLIRHFVKILPLHKIKVEGQDVVLCHYCMRVWQRSHYGSWHLFGHSHNRLEPIGKSLDVGVDGHGFCPWTWNEIKEYMKTRSDNFNQIQTYGGREL